MAPIGFRGFGTQEVDLHGQRNSQNREEGNTEKVGPKSQLEGMCGGSKRRGQVLGKISKGHRSRIPWDVEPILAFQNFGVQGIIREEERLLVVHSKSQKMKLVGNRWHVLIALEQSTIVDISCFGDCKSGGIALRTSNSRSSKYFMA